MEPETKTPIPQPEKTIKERLKASYDAIAPKYNKWTLPHSKQRMEYLSKALSHLHVNKNQNEKSNLAFLELGCGCGLPVTEKLLSYPGAKVVANDLSDTQIALARENLLGAKEKEAERNDDRIDRLHLIPGDMTTLSFPPGSFDLVVAFYSIIHLSRDDQVSLLEHIAQWLKPGGYLVANFLKEERESAIMDKWLGEEEGWMFWSGWGTEKSLEKVSEVGLDVVVADVLEDVVDDASFLWVIGKR